MDEVVLYRVDVVDRRTMVSQGVAIFATCDIEAYEAVRKEYPASRYTVVDRETGEEVDLDDRDR